MAVELEITSEGLKFIRDEILKLMVASIATAKAETLGAFELSNSATALTIAGSNHGAVCLACAIIVALGEVRRARSESCDPLGDLDGGKPAGERRRRERGRFANAAKFYEDHGLDDGGAARGLHVAELRATGESRIGRANGFMRAPRSA